MSSDAAAQVDAVDVLQYRVDLLLPDGAASAGSPGTSGSRKFD